MTDLPEGKPTGARLSADGYVALRLAVTEHGQAPAEHWFVLTTHAGQLALNLLQPGETDDWHDIPLTTSHEPT